MTSIAPPTLCAAADLLPTPCAGTAYGTAYGGMRKRIIEILSEHYSAVT